jgi:hypothetical protein
LPPSLPVTDDGHIFSWKEMTRMAARQARTVRLPPIQTRPHVFYPYMLVATSACFATTASCWLLRPRRLHPTLARFLWLLNHFNSSFQFKLSLCCLGCALLACTASRASPFCFIILLTHIYTSPLVFLFRLDFID